MRPQDIVILLKLLNIDAGWQYRELSNTLNISISEISESLHRSHIAGLIDESRRLVNRQSLMEFVEFGIHYVFPQIPGTMVIGMPTAHSHPFFKTHFPSELDFVWPYENGNTRGLSILPFYKAVPLAAEKDGKLYKLLAAIDILRVGKTREIRLAIKELNQAIL